MPALAIVVHYPASAISGGAITLASGGPFSGHGDFMNVWDQQRLTRLVDRYLNGVRR